MKRREILASALSATAALASGGAFAQSYPSRPIRWVMPFPAGGPTDVIARKLAELAGPRIGQPIVVENKPGANGSIGIGEVVRAAPDGYTFGVAIPDALVSVASLVPSAGYDARTDLTPIMKVCHAQPVLIANSKLGVRDIAELLSAARRAPGTITCGTWGPGTFPHLAIESIASATGTRFVDVPYKGLAPALQDTLAGSVQLTVVPPTLAQQHQDKGTIRALGVCGTERSPFLCGSRWWPRRTCRRRSSRAGPKCSSGRCARPSSRASCAAPGSRCSRRPARTSGASWRPSTPRPTR